jgi:hypothetical protein
MRNISGVMSCRKLRSMFTIGYLVSLTTLIIFFLIIERANANTVLNFSIFNEEVNNEYSNEYNDEYSNEEFPVVNLMASPEVTGSRYNIFNDELNEIKSVNEDVNIFTQCNNGQCSYGSANVIQYSQPRIVYQRYTNYRYARGSTSRPILGFFFPRLANRMESRFGSRQRLWNFPIIRAIRSR